MLLCSVIQLHLTLCDPMDLSPAGCFARAIFQQQYWCRVPFPPPGVLLNSVMETQSSASPALTDRFFTTEPARKSTYIQVSHTRTFKLRTFKDANMHLVPGRNQNLRYQYQLWVTLQLALLHLLPSSRCSWWPFSSSISRTLSPLQSVTIDCSPLASPWCQLLYWTIVLFKVLYYKIKNVLFCVL